MGSFRLVCAVDHRSRNARVGACGARGRRSGSRRLGEGPRGRARTLSLPARRRVTMGRWTFSGLAERAKTGLGLRRSTSVTASWRGCRHAPPPLRQRRAAGGNRVAGPASVSPRPRSLPPTCRVEALEPRSAMVQRGSLRGDLAPPHHRRHGWPEGLVHGPGCRARSVAGCRHRCSCAAALSIDGAFGRAANQRA